MIVLTSKRRCVAKGGLRRDLPACDGDWLSDRELHAFEEIRDGSRRDDWRLGRWLVKQLVRESHACPFKEIELLPRFIDRLPTRPQLLLRGQATLADVSLSHCETAVYAAVGDRKQERIGVDLVRYANVGRGFLRLWFTSAEQRQLQEKPADAMIYWGIKEASYKAMHRGERFSPTQWEVSQQEDGSLISRNRLHEEVGFATIEPAGAEAWAITVKAAGEPRTPNRSRDTPFELNHSIHQTMN